jgi:hypothetical protein
MRLRNVSIFISSRLRVLVRERDFAALALTRKGKDPISPALALRA